MDCSLPGSSVHGISQTRILEWVVIPFSRESSWLRDQTWVSCIAGKFFQCWTSKEAWESYYFPQNHLTQANVLWKVFSNPIISMVLLGPHHVWYSLTVSNHSTQFCSITEIFLGVLAEGHRQNFNSLPLSKFTYFWLISLICRMRIMKIAPYL